MVTFKERQAMWRKNTAAGFETITDDAIPEIGHPGSTTLIRKGSRHYNEHYKPSKESSEASLRSRGHDANTAKRLAREAAASVTGDFAEVQAETGRFLDAKDAFTRDRKYK